MWETPIHFSFIFTTGLEQAIQEDLKDAFRQSVRSVNSHGKKSVNIKKWASVRNGQGNQRGWALEGLWKTSILKVTRQRNAWHLWLNRFSSPTAHTMLMCGQPSSVRLKHLYPKYHLQPLHSTFFQYSHFIALMGGEKKYYVEHNMKQCLATLTFQSVRRSSKMSPQQWDIDKSIQQIYTLIYP